MKVTEATDERPIAPVVEQEADFRLMAYLMGKYGAAGVARMSRLYLEAAVKQMRPACKSPDALDAVNDLEKLAMAIEGIEQMAGATAKANAERYTKLEAKEDDS